MSNDITDPSWVILLVLINFTKMDQKLEGIGGVKGPHAPRIVISSLKLKPPIQSSNKMENIVSGTFSYAKYHIFSNQIVLRAPESKQL